MSLQVSRSKLFELQVNRDWQPVPTAELESHEPVQGRAHRASGVGRVVVAQLVAGEDRGDHPKDGLTGADVVGGWGYSTAA